MNTLNYCIGKGGKSINTTRTDVEDILYSYSVLDRDIAELEQELKDMMPNFSTSIVIFNHNARSDQGSKQEIMVTSKRYERAYNKLVRLKRIKAALDEARANLTHRELTILELKYDAMMQHQQVARRIGVTVQHYMRIKNVMLAKMFSFLTRYGIIYIMEEV
jgi:DNA-directed RNA polymerase specialized sigma subunit